MTEDRKSGSYIGHAHVDWLEAEGLLELGSWDPPGPQWPEEAAESEESPDLLPLGPLDWDVFLDESPDVGEWPHPADVERVIWGESDREHREAIGRGGFDTLAWYRQMHFNGPSWGITIRGDSVVDLATQIRRRLSSDPRQGDWVSQRRTVRLLLRSAFHVLYRHELYHHQVESLATRLELVDGFSRYWEYWANAYEPTFGTDDCLEEAMANAAAFRWFKARSSHQRALTGEVLRATRAWMEQEFHSHPPGYRVADRYFDDDGFHAAEARLAQMINNRPSRTAANFELIAPLAEPFFEWDVPLTIQNGPRSLGSLPVGVWAIQTISDKEAVKILAKHGLHEVPGGGKGSHIKMTREGLERPVIIPKARSIAPGTTKAILAAIDKKIRDIPDLRKLI